MRLMSLLAATAVLSAFACSKSDTSATDSVALATKTQATLDSISAAERAAATVPAPGMTTTTTTTGATATTPASTRTTTRRTTRSSSGGYSTGSTSSGTTASAPARTTIVKHGQRDAAISAAAGAVIGATTGGVKGAVVGGAAGAILGAVVGNNVDKTKKSSKYQLPDSQKPCRNFPAGLWFPRRQNQTYSAAASVSAYDRSAQRRRCGLGPPGGATHGSNRTQFDPMAGVTKPPSARGVRMRSASESQRESALVIGDGEDAVRRRVEYDIRATFNRGTIPCSADFFAEPKKNVPHVRVSEWVRATDEADDVFVIRNEESRISHINEKLASHRYRIDLGFFRFLPVSMVCFAKVPHCKRRDLE